MNPIHDQEPSMELDDLKSAWQSLDARLERQYALGRQLFKDHRIDGARRHLRPLWWGQLAQMLFGLVCVLLGVSCWNMHGDQWPFLLAGITLHVYGVATMIAGGITLGLVSRIDYGAPVLGIQKQLAKLRRFYVGSGAAVGLAWWVLWVPFMMALSGLDGTADASAWRQPWVYWSLGFGVAGLLATLWFHRWARSPDRPRLARKIENSVTGGSLLRARARLEEIERFERG